MGDAEDRARLRYLQLKQKAASFAPPAEGPPKEEPMAWFNKDSKPKGRLDPESSYFGVPDEDLNFAQKAERKLGDWGVVKPGRELFSPGAMSEKKKAAATALDTSIMGYLPQLAGASDYVMNNDSYLGGRDRMKKYLDSVEGGTKAIGTTVGMLPWMMGGAISEAMGQAPKAATALKTAGQTFREAVKTGAIYGGAQNPGDKEGEISPLQLKERGVNALKGAAFSGAIAAPFAAVHKLREVLASKAAGNVDEVLAIAKKLGIPPEQVPTELLTQNQVVADKAAALKRDPSMGGARVRKNLQPFDDALENTAKGFVEDAHPVTESAASVGSRVRDQVPKAMEEQLSPAKQAFEELAAPMQKAKPNTQGFKVGTTNLTNDLAASDSNGKLRGLLANEKEHFLNNIKTLEDLKKYRTSIGQRASDARRTGNSQEADMLDNLYDVLTRERNRSLETSILKSGRKIGAGARAQQTVEKLKGADALYAQVSNDARDAVGATRKGTMGSVGGVKAQLDKTSVDQLPDVLWSGRDAEQGAAFQKTFPTQHEDIRRLQLQKLNQAANKGKAISPTAMDTQLSGMSPEARGRLLGDNAPVYGEFKTLKKAMPDPNFNPSHTNIRKETLWNWNPSKQAHSLLDASELNLRRPMEYVQRGTNAEKAANIGFGARPLQEAAGAVKEGAKRMLYGAPPSSEDQKHRVLSKVRGTKYEGMLSQAADRGPDAFAANYYLLSQQYPDFQGLLNDDEELDI